MFALPRLSYEAINIVNRNTYNVTKRLLTSKTYYLQQHFDGVPKESDFKIVEEEVPALKDGQYLAEAAYISVDPYMRAYTHRMKPGKRFLGSQVAKILESKNPEFPVGKYVVGDFGCRTLSVGSGRRSTSFVGYPEAWLVPDIGNLPLSLTLGVLGMPGNTAYFGFLELCNPKPGDTVVITGAAGAVGSLVGQIAKIKGCRVIGVAGSDEKGKWLVNELGFDHFINYKTDDIKQKIKEYAPKRIDSYFDNVGGEISTTIMMYMNTFGRIAVCGAISGYNDIKPAKANIVQNPVVLNQLRMEGFIVYKWLDRWNEGVQQNRQWIEEGKLKYRETVTDGFENLVKAFTGMLRGENFGKALVKVK